MKACKYRQLLLYIHGFSNLPETVFDDVAEFQGLCDKKKPNEVLVVPVIWPCDNDKGIVKDYWDDQKAADMSAYSYARVLEKFLEWRSSAQFNSEDDPCLKRMNMLAHSMGNRVLRETLSVWDRYDLALRASKVSNLKNKIASRRLGHTGPENMEKVPSNVYTVDCDDVNTRYDKPKGHSYFRSNTRKRQPGKVFEHIFDALLKGRVQTRRLDTSRVSKIS